MVPFIVGRLSTQHSVGGNLYSRTHMQQPRPGSCARLLLLLLLPALRLLPSLGTTSACPGGAGGIRQLCPLSSEPTDSTSSSTHVVGQHLLVHACYNCPPGLTTPAPPPPPPPVISLGGDGGIRRLRPLPLERQAKLLAAAGDFQGEQQSEIGHQLRWTCRVQRWTVHHPPPPPIETLFGGGIRITSQMAVCACLGHPYRQNGHFIRPGIAQTQLVCSSGGWKPAGFGL